MPRTSKGSPIPADSLLLGQLAEEFTARVRAGELPAVEEYARRHPELAERILALFPTLLLLEGMAGANAPAAHPAHLGAGEAFGPYRLVREVGRGGMGVVYEAVHQALGKRVALKVLPAPGDEGCGLERFLREARTAAGLHHTNIVPAFDVGSVGGVPYYAMQFIDGQGLDAVLHEDQGRPRTADYFRRAAGWGMQAAEGLAHAHQRGVIHRDVKPSNLLLDEQGVVWITDFGLARRSDDVALTRSGALVGTPRYMSPEQAEAARRIDHRTDVYSLGATLYEVVTSRPPFAGDTPVDVLLQVLEREPVPPRRLDPAVPRDLETIILKAMAKRPEDRYPTAADLADDLRRFLNSEPVRARRIGLVGRTIRWARRNPAIAALSAALVLTVAAGLAAVSWKWREAIAAAHKAEILRERAEDNEREVRRQAYVANVNLAFQAWDSGRIPQALALLAGQRPPAGREDLRGFDWYYLWRQCHGDRVTLAGLEAPTSALAVSPDGGTLATGGMDGAVRLWRTADGQAGPTLGRHAGPLVALAFSGDSRGVTSFALAPSGDNADAEIRLWDLQTGNLLVERKRPESSTRGRTRFLLSPHGETLYLVSGFPRKEVTVTAWDWKRGEEKTASAALSAAEEGFPENPAILTGAALSGDGSTLAVSTLRDLLLFRTSPLSAHARGGPLGSQTLMSWAELALSPDGKRLAFSVRGTLAEPECGVVELQGEKGWYRIPIREANALAFSPDGKLLASARGGVIEVWEATGVQPGETARRKASLLGHRHDVGALVFGPRGALLASAGSSASGPGRGAEVKLWDVVAETRWDAMDARGAGDVLTAAFLPDGKALVTCKSVVRGRAELRFFDPTGPAGPPRKQPLGPGDVPQALKVLAASPDGKLLALGALELEKGPGKEEREPHPVVLLWSADTKEIRGRLSLPQQQAFFGATFSAGGRFLDVTTGRTLHRWDAAEGRMLFSWDCPEAEAEWTASSPDSKLALSTDPTAKGSRRLRLWDVERREEIGTLGQREMAHASARFSRDGRRLLTWSPGFFGEKTEVGASWTVLWDVETRQELQAWPIAGDADLSPDGRVVAVCADGIKLLDTATGLERLTLPRPEGRADRLWFSPDGRTLAVVISREDSSTLLLYRTIPEEQAATTKP